MQVEFLSKFSKDIDKINQKSVRSGISKTIILVEAADTIHQLPHLKKLAGHRSAYRLRVGDYRIGFFLEMHKVIFARVVHRKDIYKVFP